MTQHIQDADMGKLIAAATRARNWLCVTHKKYKGVGLPPEPCQTCWRGYFQCHAKEPVTGEVLALFLRHFFDGTHRAQLENSIIESIGSILLSSNDY